MSEFRFAKPSQPGAAVMALGIGVVVIIGLIGLWAAAATATRQAEIADMQRVMVRAATTTATNAGQGGLSDAAFFVGDTPQLAQAVMQTELQKLAESFGIAVEVVRTDQIEQIDSFVRLNLTISGTAPETELAGFLHGLAAMEPMVLVEEISLRPARATRTSAVRRVSFDVQLYGMAKR